MGPLHVAPPLPLLWPPGGGVLIPCWEQPVGLLLYILLFDIIVFIHLLVFNHVSSMQPRVSGAVFGSQRRRCLGGHNFAHLHLLLCSVLTRLHHSGLFLILAVIRFAVYRWS